jgi:hypothetical protein
VIAKRKYKLGSQFIEVTARKLLPLGMERNSGMLSRTSPNKIVQIVLFSWVGSNGEDASAQPSVFDWR